jgi:uncharacterized membrane protein
MEWGTLLNNAAQDAVVQTIKSVTPQPPVAVAQSSGIPYVEGKPTPNLPAAQNADSNLIFGMDKKIVIGGAVVVAIGLFLMMRK